MPPPFRWFDALPCVCFGTLYLLTLSRTLSLTHDSALYLSRIATLTPLALPNHLWFEPAMTAAVEAAWSLSPGSDAQLVVEAVNAVCGAIAMQACYVLCLWRLGLSRSMSALAVASAGLTYGIWYYSVAVEAYLAPLALCLWTLIALTSRSLDWPTTVASALAHGVAVLLHQNALLLAPVAAAALATMDSEWRRRLQHLVAYAAIAGVVVGAAYVSAAHNAGVPRGEVLQATKWAAGYLSQRRFWSRPPRAFAEAAVGYARAAVGGQVAFALPPVSDAIRRAFPRRNFSDEQFFVRQLTPREAAAIFVASALAIALLVGIGTWGAVAIARHAMPPPRALTLTVLWWALNCAFFTLWDPANPDFWIPAVCLTPILASGALQHVRGRVPAAPLAALAATMLFVTGFGTIRLASDPRNDFYTVYLRSTQMLSAEDVLVVGDAWPVRTHIRLHSQATPVYLVAEFRRRSADSLTDILARAAQSGRRVFVAPDVLEVHPSTTASFGPSYDRFARDVRRNICGLGVQLGRSDEMPLREVTCFRP